MVASGWPGSATVVTVCHPAAADGLPAENPTSIVCQRLPRARQGTLRMGEGLTAAVFGLQKADQYQVAAREGPVELERRRRQHPPAAAALHEELGGGGRPEGRTI